MSADHSLILSCDGPDQTGNDEEYPVIHPFCTRCLSDIFISGFFGLIGLLAMLGSLPCRGVHRAEGRKYLLVKIATFVAVETLIAGGMIIIN